MSQSTSTMASRSMALPHGAECSVGAVDHTVDTARSNGIGELCASLQLEAGRAQELVGLARSRQFLVVGRRGGGVVEVDLVIQAELTANRHDQVAFQLFGLSVLLDQLLVA